MKSLAYMNSMVAIAAAGMALLLPMSVVAADARGNFSVRGFGSISCQDFISTVEENDTEALLAHAHWLQGYFSAHNRMKPNTFDTVPVYGAGDIVTLVRSICERIPEQTVETAANASIDLFERAHESTVSELTTIENDGQQARVRVGIVADVQQALLERGHYAAAVDGLFGSRTATAISSFQREVGLTETGLPDLATLVELFTD